MRRYCQNLPEQGYHHIDLVCCVRAHEHAHVHVCARARVFRVSSRFNRRKSEQVMLALVT